MTVACPQHLTRERLRIAGAAGSIAAELTYPSTDAAAALVVIVNPHPLMGGTMQNNLVAALATQLALEGDQADRGLATLRFDYRGVGESEGERADVEAAMAQFWQTGTAPQDEGLIDDAAGVLRWARRHFGLPSAVVGYSFGAYAAMRAITPGATSDPASTDALVLISPTLAQHDFVGLTAAAAPTLVVYSDDDFATPRTVTETWLAALPCPAQSLCVQGGQHFFKGQEQHVAGACGAFIRSTLAVREVA